jgi:uncharacterized membrane protein YtjA (UPF0391 family)
VGRGAATYRRLFGKPVGSLSEIRMLHYAAVFFVIAIIAVVLGFAGIAVGAAEIAKVLFLIFFALAVITFLAGVLRTHR